MVGIRGRNERTKGREGGREVKPGTERTKEGKERVEGSETRKCEKNGSEEGMKKKEKLKEKSRGSKEVKEAKERLKESPGCCILFCLPDGSKNCSVSVKQPFVCLQSATETPDVLLEVVARRKGQTITSARGTFTHNPPRSLPAIILSPTDNSVSVPTAFASISPIAQWL